jgi:hypothetical protein
LARPNLITNLNLIPECGPVHRHFKKQIKSQKDEARTVPLHPDLEAELRSVHDERQPKANDFVFLTDRSRQALQVVRTAFKTGLKKAGRLLRWMTGSL